MKQTSNRIILLLGLLFILLAFGCIGAVFYQVMDEQKERALEVREIKEKMVAVDAQKTVAEREARELAGRVGRGIEFDRLLSAAQRKYGEAEQERHSGDLWIDREGGQWLVTLGALNGIHRGSRLRVFDKDKAQIGVVVAETILDVVSYVYPLEDQGQFPEDIYEVAVE